VLVDEEVAFLRSEKVKLERELEFMSKGIDKLNIELQQSKDNSSKLSQVNQIYTNNINI
jgi:hypothetical protein